MSSPSQPAVDLKSIAHRDMLDHGLEPDLPPDAAAQLRTIAAPAVERGPQIRDQRALLWCSIDNDDSRDLDQLSVAEPLAEGTAASSVAPSFSRRGLLPRPIRGCYMLGIVPV